MNEKAARLLRTIATAALEMTEDRTSMRLIDRFAWDVHALWSGDKAMRQEAELVYDLALFTRMAARDAYTGAIEYRGDLYDLIRDEIRPVLKRIEEGLARGD